MSFFFKKRRKKITQMITDLTDLELEVIQELRKGLMMILLMMAMKTTMMMMMTLTKKKA